MFCENKMNHFYVYIISSGKLLQLSFSYTSLNLSRRDVIKLNNKAKINNNSFVDHIKVCQTEF